MTIESFKSLFKFDQTKAGFVGVERECFIIQDGSIVPKAHEILSSINARRVYRKEKKEKNENVHLIPSWHTIAPDEFGYELSACQLECRIGPSHLADLEKDVCKVDQHLRMVLESHGCSALHTEVGPRDMPLDVYRDPTGRYAKITKNMPRDVLLAACRVIGTHVHIGMPNHDTALRVYNSVIQYFAELCEMGNGSFGERLAIYRQMAPDFKPIPYQSWDTYYEKALACGFDTDPRKCWTLIRISVHGTIEFRMFGATNSIERIVEWACTCHKLCLIAQGKT